MRIKSQKLNISLEFITQVMSGFCYVIFKQQHFHYGIDGICGFSLNGQNFTFRKNIQGDITHIYNTNGDLIGKYTYDAWGNHEIEVDINGIASLNPFRYRSYYYDTTTKLYYLNTRYYDSEIGRFVNADDISYLNPEILNGLNLYA